ncbi:MAG: zf-HC2 domain-containing protein [Gemmatimonadaceae bacterium]
MTDSTSRSNHPTDSELALYLDQRLTLEERDRVEAHLAACAECRGHALAAQQVLRRSRRPRLVAAGGVLAAAAVILIVLARVEPGNEQTTPQIRGVARDNTALTAYGPTGDARREGLRFVWGPAAGGVSYRLSVTSGDGAEVWSWSGVDTVASVPRSVNLRADEKYLWVADAILSDGSTRSTGLREFSLVP